MTNTTNHKWTGLWKLIEETGELQQVCGKLGVFPHGEHPDDKGNLRERLEDEIADVLAACFYVMNKNELDAFRIMERRKRKLDQFNTWGLSGIPKYGTW